MEILDQEPCGITRMDLPNRPAKLQRWVEYVAQKVRQLRKQAKLTQVELAKKSGLPQSHISRIEAAKLSPSQATLEKIAKAMGRLLSDLDPSA
ncbi:MAG: helix-turn-helix transcriptional regulator [Phycisphaerales bacterium]|nr:helix-turn-helix transcriptional regulator [Phycisphaerales bacterium]